MFLITIIFVVRVLITIKNRQEARSIKKQGERERAEICLLTNQILGQKPC